MKTLSELRASVRSRANMEHSNFVKDPEIDSYINYSAQELYDILVDSFQDYYLSESPLTTVSQGQDTIDLPSDFYKIRGVDKQQSETKYLSIDTFSFSERNDRNSAAFNYQNMDSGIRYRLQGSVIKLTPIDSCTGIYRLWYIPKMTELVLDADVLDGVNGWEDYVIVDAAIKCLQKEESDTGSLERQKAGLLKRIESASKNRNSGAAEVITPQVDRWYY